MIRFVSQLNKGLVFMLCIALLVGCTTYAGTGNEQTETHQLDKLESVPDKVTVKIDMGVGELFLQDSSEFLLDGIFKSDPKELLPVVKSGAKGKGHELSLRTARSVRVEKLKNIKNEWNVNLQEDLPYHFEIDFGVGKGKLDFTKFTQLQEVKLNLGVGDVTADFSGPYVNPVQVKIDAGVGNGTIYVPKDVGAIVKVTKGIGAFSTDGLEYDSSLKAYVNEAYNKSKNNVTININMGLGHVNVSVK